MLASTVIFFVDILYVELPLSHLMICADISRLCEIQSGALVISANCFCVSRHERVRVLLYSEQPGICSQTYEPLLRNLFAVKEIYLLE